MRARKNYFVRLYPEIHAAFKLLSDQAGYKKLNEAIERIMLKCIEANSLGIPARGDMITLFASSKLTSF